MGPTKSSPASVFDSVFVSPAQWEVDEAVVWLRGEHDLSTIPELAEIVSRAIAHDDGDLTLDLSEVLFIDAATVGLIIGAREFLRLRSRSLSLRSPSRCARRVLDLCDLTDLIESDAIEDIGPAGSATALATWVAVPATGRSDQVPLFSSPKPARLPEPVPADLDLAKQTVA